MKLNIYSVFDNKVGVYARPFFARSDAEAMRAFKYNSVVDEFMKSNAVDYDLVALGSFDDHTAAIDYTGVRSIVNLASLTVETAKPTKEER